MAVLRQHQKLGWSEKLITHAAIQCSKQKPNLIWFKTRMKAIDFYTKMEYQTKGLPFEIKGVGEHIIMFKAISDE